MNKANFLINNIDMSNEICTLDVVCIGVEKEDKLHLGGEYSLEINPKHFDDNMFPDFSLDLDNVQIKGDKLKYFVI